MKNLPPQSVTEGGYGLDQVVRLLPEPRASRARPAPTSVRLGGDFADAEHLLERGFQELVRYYRHSACGRLCQGIIHRLNTPLKVLFFQLELLEQKSLEELKILAEIVHPEGDRLQILQRYRMEKIRQFRQEPEVLQELTRSLLRQEDHEDAVDPAPLDLNKLCRQELDLYQSHPFFKHGVEKHFSFQEDLPPLYGHYIDFSQSFRNLLDNALEAMENSARRRLTVATALENGRRLLYLGDTGPGIPPGIMPRLFAPFFSTKPRPSGHAGLGLFMARRLLAPYGGEVRIDSVPGETWVTVALPVTL